LPGSADVPSGKTMLASIHWDNRSRGGGISARSASARTLVSSIAFGERDQFANFCLIRAVVAFQMLRHAPDRLPVRVNERVCFVD
jgi:hypothetical protein